MGDNLSMSGRRVRFATIRHWCGPRHDLRLSASRLPSRQNETKRCRNMHTLNTCIRGRMQLVSMTGCDDGDDLCNVFLRERSCHVRSGQVVTLYVHPSRAWTFHWRRHTRVAVLSTTLARYVTSSFVHGVDTMEFESLSYCGMVRQPSHTQTCTFLRMRHRYRFLFHNCVGAWGGSFSNTWCSVILLRCTLMLPLEREVPSRIWMYGPRSEKIRRLVGCGPSREPSCRCGRGTKANRATHCPYILWTTLDASRAAAMHANPAQGWKNMSPYIERWSQVSLSAGAELFMLASRLVASVAHGSSRRPLQNMQK